MHVCTYSQRKRGVSEFPTCPYRERERERKAEMHQRQEGGSCQVFKHLNICLGDVPPVRVLPEAGSTRASCLRVFGSTANKSASGQQVDSNHWEFGTSYCEILLGRFVCRLSFLSCSIRFLAQYRVSYELRLERATCFLLLSCNISTQVSLCCKGFTQDSTSHIDLFLPETRPEQGERETEDGDDGGIVGTMEGPPFHLTVKGCLHHEGEIKGRLRDGEVPSYEIARKRKVR
ncbi:hypothetical protein B0T26DRAFT_162920 [Lasiosphaeria miniovina]|uniref:Uncharacterized protein n=1 Tax=Lasiosphaeria miniovina TaxID=1954250 RepID=A0AA40E7R7_9PEZI|nr:uncharacterized protein B0T26DRAFT_162920 [Lasiosphaeria miniovina]KAK0728197.1 hypothetical protein B0T26DRAFT_162920 [Lasiosphaeria miniovina]